MDDSLVVVSHRRRRRHSSSNVVSGNSNKVEEIEDIIKYYWHQFNRIICSSSACW